MVKCIVVHKKYAECVIRVLKRKQLMNIEYGVLRDYENVLVPIYEQYEEDARNIAVVCVADGIKLVDCNPPRRNVKKNMSISSFDIVDNVVIIRENALRFKDVSKVIEDIKRIYPKIRAVWVKKETVDIYRTPVLELLWGEDVRDLVIKEYGLKFRVKLGYVYFNPRFAEEHHRIAEMVKPGEVVVDMFSGIGGFSIHIASITPSFIIANDLNSVAYELLLENVNLNKRKIRGTIVPLNLNSKELPGVVREESVDRIVADFPGESLNFVDEYNVLLKPGGKLHLYLLAGSVHEAELKSLSKLKDWLLDSCVEVLEYSPRLSIHRCNLIKPKYI